MSKTDIAATATPIDPPGLRAKAADRGLVRLMTILLVAVFCPVGGMTYAGLTYGRKMQWVTIGLLIAAIIGSEAVALATGDQAGPTLRRHYPFMMQQAFALGILFSGIAGIILTQLAVPTATVSTAVTLRRNVVVGTVGIVCVMLSIYGAYAYSVQNARDTKTLATANEKILAQGKADRSANASADLTERHRALMVAYMSEIGEIPGGQLTDAFTFDAYSKLAVLCAGHSKVSAQACALSTMLAEPQPTATPSRWQAVGHMLNPWNVLFQWWPETQRWTTKPSPEAIAMAQRRLATAVAITKAATGPLQSAPAANLEAPSSTRQIPALGTPPDVTETPMATPQEAAPDADAPTTGPWITAPSPDPTSSPPR